MNPGAINQLTLKEWPTGRTMSYAPLLSSGHWVKARMKLPGVNMENPVHSDKFFEEEKPLTPDSLRFPVAFYPSSSGNIRIAAQKGCFTIHGTDTQPIELFFSNPDISRFLIKVKIERDPVVLLHLRQQLQLMGLTPISVYPDLFGLSAELSGPRYMGD
jgi:hypothetical protein